MMNIATNDDRKTKRMVVLLFVWGKYYTLSPYEQYDTAMAGQYSVMGQYSRFLLSQTV